MIHFDNVSKQYGDYVAVDHLNLQVPSGQLFGFLGSNGAGKTTSIKMLTGLLKPTEGRVQIGGYDIQKQPIEAKRLFGYIPDRPFLYEKLTAREFIRFMANLYGVTSGVEAKMEDLLERFELSSSADKLIQGYSHGMKQKTALAGALIHDPQLLILDEPTVGLDPQGAKMLKDILMDFARQGKTVFMSTHILEIAERMCDRVGILKRGHLISVGTVQELQEQKGNQSLEDIFLELVKPAEQQEEELK